MKKWLHSGRIQCAGILKPSPPFALFLPFFLFSLALFAFCTCPPNIANYPSHWTSANRLYVKQGLDQV